VLDLDISYVFACLTALTYREPSAVALETLCHLAYCRTRLRRADQEECKLQLRPTEDATTSTGMYGRTSTTGTYLS
jgi:hypothetical protein